jgi:hypothetical protein
MSTLSARQDSAARAIAEGGRTDKAIASSLGVRPETIVRWRRTEAFTERVQGLQAEMAAAVVSEGIALRTKRVAALNDRWRRMQQVIDQRAEDPEMADVVGGETGLLVHTIKMIGGGRDATTVDEYAVDVGLLKELRAHEEQAAKELGQWVEKTRGELSGPNGGPIEIKPVASLTDEELDERIEAALQASKDRVAFPARGEASA